MIRTIEKNGTFTQEEILNKYCSILKSENILTIRFNLSLYYLFVILRIIFCLNPFFIFLLILIYIEQGKAMFFGISSIYSTFFLILIITIFPISLFLATFRQKKELILEKFSKTLVFNQTYPRFKHLELLNFQDIEEVIYNDNEYNFNLMFALQNSEKRDIFSGSEEDCRKLGRIIAEFLDKPFYYYKYKFIGKSEKISQ